MKKIFIIAGEASGDYLGGRLMDDIRFLEREEVEFYGVGGRCMQKSGLQTLFSIDELSLIGIAEVVGKILHVKRLIDRTVYAILAYDPDVVVTIDSSGFTHRVNRKVKKALADGGPRNIPIVHYVAPPVWAWRPWRARRMHRFIDKLLTLLPFEPKLFEKHKLKSVFVGHPVAIDPDFDRPTAGEMSNFLAKFPKNSRLITLLPGSRMSEISRHLSIFQQFSELISRKYTNVSFVIPTIVSLEDEIKARVSTWLHKPIVVTDKRRKVSALHASALAIAASGTVTLELARVGVPSLVIYKTSAITAAIVGFLMKTQYVCLVNILAQKAVIPELLQQKCTAQNIFDHAVELLESGKHCRQLEEFESVINMLKPENRRKAAEEVLNTQIMR
jgi:lipid-A-disaccharide synthase